jgi:hypothetical protein
MLDLLGRAIATRRTCAQYECIARSARITSWPTGINSFVKPSEPTLDNLHIQSTNPFQRIGSLLHPPQPPDLHHLNMKFLMVLVALMGFATAQFSQLPQCSMQCLAQTLGSAGCRLFSTACTCQKARQIVPALDNCNKQKCSVSQRSLVISVYRDMCDKMGIPFGTEGLQADAARAEARAEDIDMISDGSSYVLYSFHMAD